MKQNFTTRSNLQADQTGPHTRPSGWIESQSAAIDLSLKCSDIPWSLSMEITSKLLLVSTSFD